MFELSSSVFWTISWRSPVFLRFERKSRIVEVQVEYGPREYGYEISWNGKLISFPTPKEMFKGFSVEAS